MPVTTGRLLNEPSNKKGLRANKPKVRTGCRTCDGYRAAIPESRPRKRGNDGSHHACTALVQLASPPSFEVFEDAVEQRSFAFFQERTVNEIVGCFPDTFWAKLVPLSTHYEPAIKHAVIALGSLHERFEQGDRSILKSNRDVMEGGFALHQYTKAISHLVRPRKGNDKPPLDTSLVACVLFACFEGKEKQEHRDTYDRNRMLYKSIQAQWNKAFQVYLDENAAAKMDSKALQGAMLLKINACVMSMHLDIAAFSLLHYQTTWDEIMPTFREIVDLASTVIDAQNATDKRLGRSKPIFQLDQSLVGPLFSVAHKCRDPGIRRKAIALLYSAPRQEGVWDSILTARVAERIKNLEEKGLGEVNSCADIPDWVRISDVQVSFDLSARRGYINYLRLRSLDSKVREPITDVLEW
ncbi:MAG: hypothetical protein Q9220_005771 [cf. Caloplaca sp. 1 TL-2023]